MLQMPKIFFPFLFPLDSDRDSQAQFEQNTLYFSFF